MLGPQTSVVDGVRNTFPTSQQFNPSGYGPQTTGVPQVSPMIPPYMGGSVGRNSGVSATGAAQVDGENVDGYGTAGNNAMVTAIAANNPHNLKVSPVWWTVGLMIVGLFLLHVVHFGGSVSTSAGAGAGE